ncbi:MAG: aspartate-semialdehyde dehydrogenase [Bdellovibrionaceae bacterium]|nr:aspartate-semialdehyde dehydrogenase [Pseudobdellovibrionaceae bacterium]
MKSPINIGVVGATGMVGESFLNLIEKRNFPFGDVRLFASERSLGQTRKVGDKEFPIEELSEERFHGLDVVFFSSGDDISKEWAPKAAQAGAFAIDNSAAFRMSSRHELIVPEINGARIPANPTIIANPNCSTIQLVMALNALKNFGLQSVQVASYQSVSGAGMAGQKELADQLLEDLKKDNPIEDASKTSSTFGKTPAFNCVPKVGSFDEDGFCSEEVKIVNETKKILELPDLRVSAFTVRIPSWNSHAEAVWVELEANVQRDDLIAALRDHAGIRVKEELTAFETPRELSGVNEVSVSRVQKDFYGTNRWRMWVVADNLLKGAALNGIQIAEYLLSRDS